MKPAARESLPLLPVAALVGGTLAAVIDGVRLVVEVASNGIDAMFNDFYDYWGAAVLLNRGGNPYDTGALRDVLHSAGLHTVVGGGYSYPLLLAQLLRPLALLAPHAAALVFSAFSVVGLGLAAALVLGSLRRLRVWHAILGGSAFAVFPPLMGSLYFGQVNLLVLAALALAWRRVHTGSWLAVAGAIKLYPVTGFLSHLTHPSRELCRQLLTGGAVLAGLLLLPQVGAHGSFVGQSGALLAPDTYWTNASVNGVVSRLSMRSDWTTPPFPWLPVSATVLAVCAVLTVAAVAVLVRTRHASQSGRLALCLCLGVVIAPKNSFWNFAPLILAVAAVWQMRGQHWWPLALTAIGWLLIQAQSQIDTARDTFYRGGAGMTWLSGLGLYGALLIGTALACLLLMDRGGAGVSPGAGARPPGTPLTNR